MSSPSLYGIGRRRSDVPKNIGKRREPTGELAALYSLLHDVRERYHIWHQNRDLELIKALEDRIAEMEGKENAA